MYNFCLKYRKRIAGDVCAALSQTSANGKEHPLPHPTPLAASGGRGVDLVGWGLDPLKICKRVRVCFGPKNFTFFHSKLLLDNSASFTSSRMKDLCQKWKVKLILRGAWNSFIAWPDWPWPPYFTTDLRHCRAIQPLITPARSICASSERFFN